MGVAAVAEGVAGSTTRRPLDARALERHAMRLMRRPAPWLHEEVARRMAERLAILKRAPRHIVDWGARLGGSEAALLAACPQARRIAAEVLPEPASALVSSRDPSRPSPRLSVPAPWWSARRWWPAGEGATPAPAESALPEGEADLLWSNMVLHHQPDPRQSMARWLRLLAVEGLLMFSTLGPGTLESLRRLYAARRWPAPHAPFVDMHDLGDMLVEAGFADPVMDQEVLTLTWATPAEALAELRALGGNADSRRHAGLRTPRWRAALEQALAQAQARTDGRVAMEFEVVYGHAVRPVPRARVAAETAVPLADMRGMLRGRSPKGPTR
ncbi:MAG: methyltransferase domain-containing protein [Burkholderiales bacterium]|nr:methyltransferase domain-containing protein [Burkholderiales bacterium]